MTLSQSKAASEVPPAQRRLAVYQPPCPMLGGPQKLGADHVPPGPSHQPRPVRAQNSDRCLDHRATARGQSRTGECPWGAGSSMPNSSGLGARATRWASASAKVPENALIRGKGRRRRSSPLRLQPAPEGRQVDEEFRARKSPLEEGTVCASTGHEAIRRSTHLHYDCKPEFSLIPMTVDRWP